MHSSGCMVTYCPVIRDSVSIRPCSKPGDVFNRVWLYFIPLEICTVISNQNFPVIPKNIPVCHGHLHRIWFHKAQVPVHLALQPVHAVQPSPAGPTQNWQSYGLFGNYSKHQRKCGIQRSRQMLHFFVGKMQPHVYYLRMGSSIPQTTELKLL